MIVRHGFLLVKSVQLVIDWGMSDGSLTADSAAAPSSRSSVPSSAAPDLAPFRFVGGSLALDFVNTVNWTERGRERDSFVGYEDLVAWGGAAGVLGPEAAMGLRAGARRDPDQARRALARAHALREVLQRLFTAVASGRAPEAAVLRRFNEELAEAQARLFTARLEVSSGEPAHSAEAPAFEWRWRGMGEDADCMLWPVVRAAAELLVSAEVARVRLCAGEACGWIYVDRSRNGLRRWCEMRTCGSVAKSRRYYQRTRRRLRDREG